MNKRKHMILYVVYILFFVGIWIQQTGALFLYNKSVSVPLGWYFRQMNYRAIDCDPLYVAIHPLWIAQKFPTLARSLINMRILVLKYVDDKIRQHIISKVTIPKYIRVHTHTSRAISSVQMGLVPDRYIQGLYCPLFNP